MLRTHLTTVQIRQSDFAAALDISPGYLSDLLSGKKQPSLDLAVRIERLTKGAVPATSWVPPAIVLNETSTPSEDAA